MVNPSASSVLTISISFGRPLRCANIKSSNPIWPPSNFVISTLCEFNVQNMIWKVKQTERQTEWDKETHKCFYISEMQRRGNEIDAHFIMFTIYNLHKHDMRMKMRETKNKYKQKKMPKTRTKLSPHGFYWLEFEYSQTFSQFVWEYQRVQCPESHACSYDFEPFNIKGIK